MTATIYYDGECPFCARYTSLLRLQDGVGSVRLVDVRTDHRALQTLSADGFDLDEGMVLDLDGTRYSGSEAMHRLALLSTRANWFNRLNAFIFSSGTASALLYPVLRAGRNAVLFAKGHHRIHSNETAALSLFAIYSHAFGMYAFADFLYSVYVGTASLVTYGFGVSGLYLLIRPRSPRTFAFLWVAMLGAAVFNMPTFSNHAILFAFAGLAVTSAAVIAWITGWSWTYFFSAFAPVGRALLVTMYFFGVFHKINTGFLDPNVSCAVELWKLMPWPLSAVDAIWWRYSMIYGTLFGEAAILIGLLVHRTRYWAIMLGIAFHSLLALSNYGFYLAFSTLTISLHLLFLSPAAATRITSAPAWRLLQARVRTPLGVGGVICWAGLFYALAQIGHFNSIALLWMPWSIWLIGLVGRYAREQQGETTLGPPMRSKAFVLNGLSVLFVFNCLTPFLGLKNAQAMNMFANLTYEGGRSNHLIVPATAPFGYMSDVVELLEIDGTPYVSKWGTHMTYYGLLDLSDRSPGATFKYVRNGRAFIASSATLAEDLKQLHPKWVRSWMHFREFNTHERAQCEPGS